jgi:hypothetical protein
MTQYLLSFFRSPKEKAGRVKPRPQKEIVMGAMRRLF